MNDSRSYWLVSVPKRSTGDDTFGELTRLAVNERQVASNNYKFDIPDLRVGNMDTLVQLTDELKKVAVNVESTLKKIANQYFDLQKELHEKDAPKDKENKKIEIEVRGTNAETFLTRFRWDDARYPRRKAMPELVSSIRVQVLKMEAELKQKTSEYQGVVQKINVLNQAQTGSLLTRDFSKEVKDVPVIDTEFLTTLFLVVPRQEVKEWQKSYETLAPFVVPRSSIVLLEEQDYTLFSVVVFKRDVGEFTNAARQKRFTVRKTDPAQQMSDEEVKALHAKLAKVKKQLMRWTLTNFGESFLAMVHLKCIQCFVESVLRFGLPADFEAMLILPKKGKEKNLEKVLVDLYKHLAIGREEDNEQLTAEDELKNAALLGSDKFFPYIFLEINIDMH